MDMQPSPDTGNIPPEALQQLQQMQGGGGMDITAILAQLSQMSPDEVSGALQQLGINVPPAQLQKAAEDWVEQSAGKAAGEPTIPTEEGEADAEAPTPTPSAPPTDDEDAEAVPDDEAAEGEAGGGDADMPPNAMPTSGSGMPPSAMAAMMQQQGGGAMPRGGGAGGNIDALISAALSQGDPQSMPAPRGLPMRGGGGPRMGGPAMPGAGVPSATGDDPRLKAMLQSIYRQQGGDARRGVPTGPRGPQTGASAGRKRNV